MIRGLPGKFLWHSISIPQNKQFPFCGEKRGGERRGEEKRGGESPLSTERRQFVIISISASAASYHPRPFLCPLLDGFICRSLKASSPNTPMSNPQLWEICISKEISHPLPDAPATKSLHGIFPFQFHWIVSHLCLMLLLINKVSITEHLLAMLRHQ